MAGQRTSTTFTQKISTKISTKIANTVRQGTLLLLLLLAAVIVINHAAFNNPVVQRLCRALARVV